MFKTPTANGHFDRSQMLAKQHASAFKNVTWPDWQIQVLDQRFSTDHCLYNTELYNWPLGECIVPIRMQTILIKSHKIHSYLSKFRMFQLTGESHLSPYGESLTNHRVAVETKILLVQGCQNKYLRRMQPALCPLARSASPVPHLVLCFSCIRTFFSVTSCTISLYQCFLIIKFTYHKIVFPAVYLQLLETTIETFFKWH